MSHFCTPGPDPCQVSLPSGLQWFTQSTGVAFRAFAILALFLLLLFFFYIDSLKIFSPSPSENGACHLVRQNQTFVGQFFLMTSLLILNISLIYMLYTGLPFSHCWIIFQLFFLCSP